MDRNEVVGTIQSLEVEAYVAVDQLKTSFWNVNNEGKRKILQIS